MTSAALKKLLPKSRNGVGSGPSTPGTVARKGGTYKLYNSYTFHDKDPVIYEVRDAMEAERLTIQQLSDISGVSAAAISGWLYGATRCPQNATVMAAMRAMGYQRTWSKDGQELKTKKMG